MEYYFTISATECEHGIIEWDFIRPFCTRIKAEVAYYRKFKTGHIPMQRECKIINLNRRSFALLKKWAETRDCPITFENYWKKVK